MAGLVTLPMHSVPSAMLVLAFLVLMRTLRYSGYGIALLSLGGTIGHELLHGAVGWLLRAKPTSFSIIPKKDGNRWVLGSVSFTNLNIWNSAPVAFAPLLLVGIAWLTFRFWMQPAFLAGQYLNWFISGYIVAACLFSCIPSSTDFKIGALSGLMYGSIGYLLWTITR